MQEMKVILERAMQNAKGVAERRAKVYRFDVFKGVADASGKIHKIKSVGSAHLMDGAKTYTVYLKTFLKDVFYLLPEQKKITEADYVILTREPSQRSGRKYFWNNVGECKALSGANAGLMRMSWDVLGADDIYMNLYPQEREVTVAAEASEADGFESPVAPSTPVAAAA